MSDAEDRRPRPQFGEYAEPETEERSTDAAASGASTSDADPAAGQPMTTTASAEAAPSVQRDSRFGVAHGAYGEGIAERAPEAGATAQATDSHQAGMGGRLPGVPHNLGVRREGVSAPAGRSSSVTPPAAAPPAQHGEPYRAASPHGQAQQTPQAQHTQLGAPPAAQNAAPGTPGAPYPATGQAARRPNAADRIITIVLLAVGAYFALSMAFSLSQFPTEFGRVAGDLGLTDFVSPSQVQTIGTIGAILVLAIYALVLIFSIRRLRAGKITFWAPLAAGVLSWVIFFVLFAIGLNQSPELWQELMRIASDPAEAQQLLEKLSNPS